MAGFLHGPEFKDGGTQKVVIKGANISTIGVIGTAPIFLLDEENRKINELMDVSDHTKKAKYLGENLSNYTLYDAVDTILAESGGASIYAVNVFDPQKHKSDVSEKEVSFVDGKITLEHKYVFNLTVKQDDAPVSDENYTFEDGVISKKEGSTLSTEKPVKVSYSYPDPSKVTAADIIGSIDEYDTKTGLKCFIDLPSIYKTNDIGILIAPVFEAMSEVEKEIENIAEELGAYSYIAAPISTTKDDALKGRNGKGAANFNTVSKRVMLLYPFVGRYNSYENEDQLKSPSAVAAGMRVYLDDTRGIQKSLSNTLSKTITRLETPISYRPGKTNTDANNLNAAGISVFMYHKGYRSFGNRSANFPDESGAKTFECIQRVGDFIERSIVESTTGITDEPITTGLIDSVVSAVNSFLDNLKNPQNPVIIGGSFWYDSNLNTAEDIADGWTKFCFDYAPPTPNERTTYYREVNIQLYKNIGSEATNA